MLLYYGFLTFSKILHNPKISSKGELRRVKEELMLVQKTLSYLPNVFCSGDIPGGLEFCGMHIF